MNEINWQLKSFEELTNLELYKLLKARSEVFVVEQNCVYLDTDSKDIASYHLCGWVGDELAAYVRILPAGLAFEEVSIGRVLTHPSFRSKGMGKSLMKEAIAQTEALYGKVPVRIGAQLYLEKFYTELGFRQVSEQYLEDDIPHIEMLLSK
ncbi:GNAT family N-acetyltransferase [Ferruginibacter sp. HRS2-29]|uniref:GNAT family N-acetyltransferase n=1 Tax=Ferruginibacter sp. HRS2-29 TaxID=2487334 RepID=UPI0020CDD217|nr:GNAT family N-acetyltransferase [Ferruginibacter sp. HRS2-29]